MRRGVPGTVRGFTLTELLVAVAVLIVVILATARIFGTVSSVAGVGEANADLLQTATTIERQVRADVERMSREGFLVLQSVEVPNDVNGSILLNSALPAGTLLRCDQLAFFALAPQSGAGFVSTNTSGDFYGNAKQAMLARVYWGHAVQLRNAPPLADPFLVPGFGFQTEAGRPLVPWLGLSASFSPDSISTVNWATGQLLGETIATQPSAREWILARQVNLIADDGGSPFWYHQTSQLPTNKNSTRDLWAGNGGGSGNNRDPGAFSSRIDFSYQLPNSIRRTVLGAPFGNAVPNDMATQRARMLQVVGVETNSPNALPARWPRAEKVAPSMNRADQMLTNPVISGQCSSFAVEWTYDDGVGRQFDPLTGGVIGAGGASPLVGIVVRGDNAAPWFGLPEATRGTLPLSASPGYTPACGGPWGCLGGPIVPANIEGVPAVRTLASGGAGPVRLYQATFGYNADRALDDQGNLRGDYTPWPTALRFTFTLHDPKQRFTEGRTFQFVVELPRR